VKLLLDACTFLWIVNKEERLSSRAAGLFQSADNEVYLGAASVWEIGIKYQDRRLTLAEPPDRFVPAMREAHGILALPIDEESVLHGARLPFLHRDPFDRLLVGQAIVHGMTILTPDPIIRRYPARTIW
jgi:PIN domain nuclease of toxin-antitoxin system